VIEDDPEVSQVIAWVLEDHGWSTDVAVDGEQGVARAVHRKPSLVVLDINLPKLSGEAVADRLHALYNGIPILVVTANDTAKDSAQRARACGYLRKPFELEALVTSVERGLEGGRSSEHTPHRERG
jgi:two-component system, OmpR family, response regulator